ncbi:MAG: hypothetical protein P8I55_15260 [Crocinitomix sp.]|nr:hypothetical protein [Crocinitomix sp.]
MSFMFYAIIFGEQDVFHNEALLGFFLSIFLAFILGLAYDAYDTHPILKLLAQILCGVLLVLTGNEIQLFPWPVLNAGMTIFWVAAIMNSINMLDNMDGIAKIGSFS